MPCLVEMKMLVWFILFSGHNLTYFKHLRKKLPTLPSYKNFFTKIKVANMPPTWSYKKGLIFFKNWAYLQPSSPLVQSILSSLHNQHHEGYQNYPVGLLQPLPIPLYVWVDISIDFIDSLPNSYGKTFLLVLVDKFSKYTHFIQWLVLTQLPL